MNILKNKSNLLKTILLISGFLLLSGYNSASAALVSTGGTISANTTWNAGDTYQVTSSITLNAGCTLTIPAGAVVKFNPGTSITVYGNLQAIGTLGNEVYFTSRDDDTVGSGATSSDHIPTKGDWDRINMVNGSSSSVLDHVVIRYPSYGIYTSNASTAFTIKNSTITQTFSYGISLDRNSAVATFSGNTISSGSGGGMQIGRFPGGVGQIITNNTIVGNTGKGLDCVVETTIFTNNNFSGNGKPSRFCTIEPLLTGNPTNTNYSDTGTYFEVYSIKMSLVNTGTLPKLSGPVVLYGGTLESTKNLTISPGNIFRIDNTSVQIFINGNLQAIGTTSEPIVFTSKNDNTAGGILTGSTISNGTPAKGDWYGIIMTTGSSSSVLDHVVIRYPSFGIYMSNASTTFTVKNSTITQTLSYGISLDRNSAVATFSGNTISSGSGGGMQIGRFPGGVGQIVTNNTVVDNTGKGLDCIIETTIFTNNNFSGNGKPSRFCTIEPLLTENPTNTTYSDTGIYFEVYSIKMPLVNTGTLPKLSGPIVIYGGTLESTKTLNIAPGNIFRIDTSLQIYIYGNIQAIGTTSEPIVFTSKNDNTAGGILTGSTISNGTPTKGDWRGIIMMAGSNSSVLDHVVIRYPSYGIYTSNIPTTYTLRNSTITYTSFNGIYLNNNSGVSTISGNTISSGSGVGIYIASGVGQIVTNNTIVKNTGVGISLGNTTSTIKNNISYGNSYGILCTTLVSSGITYNLFPSTSIQSGTNCTIGGTNKTTSDPLFVDYANSNYRLQATSPAINAGDPTMGNHPLSGDRYDIGAYEYYITGITGASEATISNPDGRTLEYIWTFTSDPSGGGVAKPVFIGTYTGTTSDVSKTVSCNYTIKYKGNYRIKLSLSESGSGVVDNNYGFTIQ